MKLLLPLPQAALLLILFACASCDKDELDRPEGPACSAADSRLASRSYLYPGRDTTISYGPDGLLPGQVAAGPDTVIETGHDDVTTYYIFNRSGELAQIRYVWSPPQAAAHFTDQMFAYNDLHQMVRRWTYDSRNLTVPIDSIGMVWEGGNLTSEINLLDRGNVINRYEYYPGGDGRNPENTPFEASRWLYRRQTPMATSKDYLRGGWASYYQPGFDSKGRLMELQITGHTGKYAYTYQYTCR